MSDDTDTTPRNNGRANAIIRGVLGACLLFLGLLIIPIFVATIHWFVAVDVNGPLPVDAPVPPGVRAVVWNKGHYDPWPWGTIAQNPLGFAIWVATVACWLLLTWWLGYLRGQTRTRLLPPPKRTSDPG